VVVLLLIIGFPVTAILSWIFDITPEGVKKTEHVRDESEMNEEFEEGRRKLKISDGIIAALLVIVCILIYPFEEGTDALIVEAERAVSGKNRE